MKFDWLGSITKDTITPTLVFSSGFDFQGCYVCNDNVYCIDGREYRAKNGLVVLSMDQIDGIREEANTIAHEWRHHFQRINGMKFTLHKYDWTNDYEASLAKWKTLSTERDAVLFAEQYVRTPYADFLRSVMEV